MRCFRNRCADYLTSSPSSPQRWAYQEQIGSYLLRQPDRVRDMIRAVKARLGSDYCVSVKIRVDDDLQRTDALVRTALHAGANLLTIHGRTRQQSSTSHPVSLPAIRFAVDAARSCGNLGTGGTVPCVANGDVFTRDEAEEWRERTAARGVMSARGLLANPVSRAYRLLVRDFASSENHTDVFALPCGRPLGALYRLQEHATRSSLFVHLALDSMGSALRPVPVSNHSIDSCASCPGLILLPSSASPFLLLPPAADTWPTC